MSKTPRVDLLIEEGASSQNEYITKLIELAKQLEWELSRAEDNSKLESYYSRPS